jgi:hypothetical protein
MQSGVRPRVAQEQVTAQLHRDSRWESDEPDTGAKEDPSSVDVEIDEDMDTSPDLSGAVAWRR